MKKQIISVLFLICSCYNGYSSDEIEIPVSIDSRVELLCILSYLSDYPEYGESSIETYKLAVDEFFKKYRNHEAIIFMKQIRIKNGFSYDAPMSFAIYLTDSLTPIIPFSQTKLGYLNNDEYNKLAILVREFAKDSKYDEFYINQIKKYEKDLPTIKEKINSSINFNWFTSFFGHLSQSLDLKIIVSLTNGPSSYGPNTVIDNIKTNYSIIGAFNKAEHITISSAPSQLIVHEFCHSYCNPIINEYKDTLEVLGKRLYDDFVSRKHQAAYNSWITVLYETLVRTSTLSYLKQNENSRMVKRDIKSDDYDGFLWIKPLSDSFIKLNKTTTIDKSKDLYMNEFIKIINDYLDNRKN
jgi:hypothetical protein